MLLVRAMLAFLILPGTVSRKQNVGSAGLLRTFAEADLKVGTTRVTVRLRPA
jgi:hypothetical protein